MSWREPFAAVAREHLPPEIAKRWIALLRPAFALAPEIDGPVVGQLGGLPMLPDDVAWPVWKHSADEPAAPLAYRARVDCGALPAGQLDIPLPATGALHFFADDDVFREEPGQHQATRIHYVPDGVEVQQRPAPPPFTTTTAGNPLVQEQTQLCARLVASTPHYYSAFLGAEFWQPEPDYDFGEGPHPNWLDPAAGTLLKIFPDEIFELMREGMQHNQLGGYASLCQWSPENLLWPRPDYPFRDRHAHGRGSGPGRTGPDREAGRLLLSIKDEVPDMRHQWVIRPDDLAALRFEAAAFDTTRW